MSLPQTIAAKAEAIVNSLAQTNYQHKDNIDPAAGVYDCDCNGFVGFVLQNTTPNHLARVPKELNQPRPRAFEYFTFFASLTSDSARRLEEGRSARGRQSGRHPCLAVSDPRAA